MPGYHGSEYTSSSEYSRALNYACGSEYAKFLNIPGF